MLELEFVEKSGCSISDYSFANEVYMSCDVSKDDFCREWWALRSSKVVESLMGSIKRLSYK